MREVDGVSYVRFIVPGLVMLSLIQNSFLNTASSMFIAKMQGTIVDLLVAPLSPGELLAAFTLAAVVRGVHRRGIVWLVAAHLHRLLDRAPGLGRSRSRCSSPPSSRSSGSSSPSGATSSSSSTSSPRS